MTSLSGNNVGDLQSIESNSHRRVLGGAGGLGNAKNSNLKEKI